MLRKRKLERGDDVTYTCYELIEEKTQETEYNEYQSINWLL